MNSSINKELKRKLRNMILSLWYNDSKYPSLDHKVSILYGFENGIPPEEISDLKNLCITKRSLNSSKGFKTEELYKQKNQS